MAQLETEQNPQINQYNSLEIRIDRLTPGMKPAKNILNKSGKILLTQGHPLNKTNIEKLTQKKNQYQINSILIKKDYEILKPKIAKEVKEIQQKSRLNQVIQSDEILKITNTVLANLLSDNQIRDFFLYKLEQGGTFETNFEIPHAVNVLTLSIAAKYNYNKEKNINNYKNSSQYKGLALRSIFHETGAQRIDATSPIETIEKIINSELLSISNKIKGNISEYQLNTIATPRDFKKKSRGTDLNIMEAACALDMLMHHPTRSYLRGDLRYFITKHQLRINPNQNNIPLIDAVKYLLISSKLGYLDEDITKKYIIPLITEKKENTKNINKINSLEKFCPYLKFTYNSKKPIRAYCIEPQGPCPITKKIDYKRGMYSNLTLHTEEGTKSLDAHICLIIDKKLQELKNY